MIDVQQAAVLILMCSAVSAILGLLTGLRLAERLDSRQSLGAALARSLEHEPHRWTLDEFHARRDCGLAIWVANGRMFLRIEKPFRKDLGLLDRWLVHRAVERLKEDRARELLEKPS